MNDSLTDVTCPECRGTILGGPSRGRQGLSLPRGPLLLGQDHACGSFRSAGEGDVRCNRCARRGAIARQAAGGSVDFDVAERLWRSPRTG